MRTNAEDRQLTAIAYLCIISRLYTLRATTAPQKCINTLAEQDKYEASRCDHATSRNDAINSFLRAYRSRHHGVSYRRSQQLHADCRPPSFFVSLALIVHQIKVYFVVAHKNYGLKRSFTLPVCCTLNFTPTALASNALEEHQLWHLARLSAALWFVARSRCAAQ
eukprot:6209911-Pleurochrysis_carterae.AAC.4